MNLIVNSKLNACYPNLSKPTLITYASNVCKILELVDSKSPEYLYKNYPQTNDYDYQTKMINRNQMASNQFEIEAGSFSYY